MIKENHEHTCYLSEKHSTRSSKGRCSITAIKDLPKTDTSFTSPKIYGMVAWYLRVLLNTRLGHMNVLFSTQLFFGWNYTYTRYRKLSKTSKFRVQISGRQKCCEGYAKLVTNLICRKDKYKKIGILWNIDVALFWLISSTFSIMTLYAKTVAKFTSNRKASTFLGWNPSKIKKRARERVITTKDDSCHKIYSG